MTKIDEVVNAAFADLRTARARLSEAMNPMRTPEEVMELIEEAYGLIHGVLEDKPR